MGEKSRGMWGSAGMLKRLLGGEVREKIFESTGEVKKVQEKKGSTGTYLEIEGGAKASS